MMKKKGIKNKVLLKEKEVRLAELEGLRQKEAKRLEAVQGKVSQSDKELVDKKARLSKLNREIEASKRKRDTLGKANKVKRVRRAAGATGAKVSKANIVKDNLDHLEQGEFRLMRQAFGSGGGKSAIAKRLIKLLPEHDTYLECFSGGAALYFNKKPSKVEVLNDLDRNISNSYKYLKVATEKDVDILKGILKPMKKTEFVKLKNRIYGTKDVDGVPVNPDVYGFANFYLITYYSFASDRDSFGFTTRTPHVHTRLMALKERLRGTTIENMDAVECIKKYDSPSLFVYSDPPYPKTWRQAKHGYSYEDVQELLTCLKGMRGKFMLSLGKDEKVRQMVHDMGFKVNRIKTRRIANQRKGHEAKSEEYEYLVMNYDPKGIKLADYSLKEEPGKPKETENPDDLKCRYPFKPMKPKRVFRKIEELLDEMFKWG